ncbi:hypothetical protein QN355_11760 [Cryobacterium sp. 10S3]|uniref:hypothetical protein n=1 Tax=Cryobacterium sp. 10S3 TaxID=3048582 RepID=UPI002AC966A8|nr:hypothetical protein [Cryobacterium sp. 10S3]MEB0287230.1 hypothetical protein [Cryobacterium sp. 10S3]WPX14185.1 hypothetical protein RHM57_02080 [Cryobacterium sp. 10S3]
MSDITPETPKAIIAKSVVTPKRMYFSPIHGSIEAKSLEEVVSKVSKLVEKLKTKETKVSDGR